VAGDDGDGLGEFFPLTARERAREIDQDTGKMISIDRYLSHLPD